MNQQSQAAVQPAITFLNMSGDVTLTWDQESEESILALVEAKMKEGYSFFILEPRKLGFIPLPAKKVDITTIEQARKAGRVTLADEDVRRGVNRVINAKVDDPQVEKVLATGKARLTLVVNNNRPMDTVARATTPQQVVSNQTVAVRRIAGG